MIAVFDNSAEFDRINGDLAVQRAPTDIEALYYLGLANELRARYKNDTRIEAGNVDLEKLDPPRRLELRRAMAPSCD